MKKAIVWFRQDLRLHDNEALQEAARSADKIFPVFVFDEKVFFGKTRFGFPKTGKYRAQFILDSVDDLRKSLQHYGSNLIIRIGRPEKILYELAKELRTSWIFCNRERTQEEVLIQDKLEKKLWSIGQEMRFSRGKMLYYTQDLPFPITHTPDVFSAFRKEVEKITPVRKPIEFRSNGIQALPQEIDIGKVPSMNDLGWDAPIKGRFRGGESEGKRRLKYYLWDTDLVSKYKQTRDGLLGDDYSSKFSPYLAQGCLSPKMIYHEVKKYENHAGSNQSTYLLNFELVWRDFFRLMAKKHGNKIFLRGGFREKQVPWQDHPELFEKWASGNTGIPFIDANMRELNQTGFMSNRGRRNVASYFIHDLGIDWTKGASYFESQLTDYDPCSNYGNWNYLAGVGADSRSDRQFNIENQAKRFDPQGLFVKTWIPELENIPSSKIHDPESWSESDLIEAGIELGKDYPYPSLTTGRI